jgi:hypothetical protein
MEPFAELQNRVTLFERIQIATLQVLDERDLENPRLVDVNLDARDLSEARRLGRVEAALAGDDLEALTYLPDEDRLEDTFLLDRGDQIGKITDGAPGLVRVRIEEFDLRDPWGDLGV